MIMDYKGISPVISDSCYVAPSADIIGDVKIGEESSVWFSAVIRGDMAPITIGKRTSIQDNCTLHCEIDSPIYVGDNVTVGHNAVLHSCRIGDNTLIGMNSTVLNGAVIGKNCVVGAGAVVTQNKVFEDNSLIIGCPAKAVKKIDKEGEIELSKAAGYYVDECREYRSHSM
ncbi:MAG: gamma carbonic anhydrase family protein [Clostridiales bacterium]|nr:gamma carbonic anhydrase family protein [Clostridiales bacterium]